MTDLRAASGELGDELGPIGQAVKHRNYQRIWLLSDHGSKTESGYVRWLKKLARCPVSVHQAKLSNPTDFNDIYEAAISAIATARKAAGRDTPALTFHLSPGTPAMAAVWIILSKTSHPGELIESSTQAGVKTVSLPFEIAAEYLPRIVQERDTGILQLTQGLPPQAPEFNQIIHRCHAMKHVIAQARRIAPHEVPVLILGESGTGKELFARAIHASSLRQNKPFVAVNCGAIPRELVEAEFFGHEKGAFTGAVHARAGYLEDADGGTLFLDEVGELPLHAQVKLLRALQEGMVKRVGANKAKKVDIRVIAATNRDLQSMVAEGCFRDDLFHRIAVGVLKIPPLRERQGDLNLIVNQLLEQINKQCAKQPGWMNKKLSAGARNLMQRHPWPGNVRELANTLSRAAIWAAGETIRKEDMEGALFPVLNRESNTENILNRPLGNGLDLQELIGKVAEHYLKRALIEAQGSKTVAAKLVGLPSYQTLTNWLEKYKVSL